MRIFRADRHLLAGLVTLAFGLYVPPAFPQARTAPPPAPGNAGNVPTSPGDTPTRGTGNIPNANNPNNNGPFSNDTNSYPQRSIFLSGKVMFDDGTPPNNDIRIERVCGINAQFEAHTDSKGRFSFQLDNNPFAATDIDPANAGNAAGYPNRQMDSRNAGTTRPGGYDQYWNCEIRASYPGYRSDVVELSGRRPLDNPDVGTILLHRLMNVKGTTISLTTALAPKHAQKDYEKGVQLAQKGKFDEAEEHLLKATEAYPKYAIAWFALGQVQQKQNKAGEARKSFQAAASADNKFVSPYDQLALLAARDGNWGDAANFSKQVIDLNPVEFPSDFWYNAVANYNLKKMDEAQKSAQELLKVDTKHQFPEAEGMLAQIYLQKGKYDEAAAHLKAYLALAPNAKNADALKMELLKLEQAKAEPKK